MANKVELKTNKVSIYSRSTKGSVKLLPNSSA